MLFNLKRTSCSAYNLLGEYVKTGLCKIVSGGERAQKPPTKSVRVHYVARIARA